MYLGASLRVIAMMSELFYLDPVSSLKWEYKKSHDATDITACASGCDISVCGIPFSESAIYVELISKVYDFRLSTLPQS